MENRPAYLIRPGASITSILLNIPHMIAFSGQPPPVILMDVYDYNRLQARSLTDEGDQKDHYLVLAFDELRRQGIVRLIDYANFYPTAVQHYYLHHNQALLEQVSAWEHRRAAIKGVKDWTGYARGAYQEPFRAGLGEEPETFADLRQAEQRLRRKMKNGTGDPVGWNEKLLDKAVAALAVRSRADQVLDLDIRGVVAGSEHDILDDLRTVTQPRQDTKPVTDHQATGAESNDTIGGYLEHLAPTRRIVGLTPERVSTTRAILDTIGEIATEVAGVQHDDWFLLTPTFALPHYHDLFNFDVIRAQIRHRLDERTLVTETERAIAALDSGTAERSSSHLRYEAEWIAEQSEGFTVHDMTQQDGLSEMVDYAFQVSNYSREIRALLDRDHLSQTAVFLGASIMSDPTTSYREPDVQHRSAHLLRQLNPSVADEMNVEAFRQERTGETWGDHTDWYETVDRTR